MRYVIPAVLALTLTSAPRPGFAQPPANTPPPAPRTVPPPIVMPFAPLMPPPTGGLSSRENPPFRTEAPPLFFPVLTTPVYGPYPIGPTITYTPAPDVPVDRVRTAPPAATPAVGWLRLDVSPESAEVYVDSFFVATVAEVNARRLLTLDAGPHRIEIRAGGYAPLTFDVRIAANETVSYRRTLERVLPSAAAPRTVSPTASVLYVIPGCYAGNLPPRAGRLPAGCDIAKVQTIKNQ